MAIIDVSNPYFKRDFVQVDNEINWLDTGCWCICWKETYRVGFLLKVKSEKQSFSTREQARNFADSLIKKMYK